MCSHVKQGVFKGTPSRVDRGTMLLGHLVSCLRLHCPYCMVSVLRLSLWPQMAQGMNYLLLFYDEVSIETESNHLEIFYSCLTLLQHLIYVV